MSEARLISPGWKRRAIKGLRSLNIVGGEAHESSRIVRSPATSEIAGMAKA